MTQDPELRLTDLKRASIVNAAVSEFRRCGYYAASMNQIAELAQVSKRTLYKHFGSKDQLFDAIVDELMVRVDEIPYNDFDPAGELAEQLEALAQTEIQAIASEPVQALARAGLSRLLGEPEVARSLDHDRFLEPFVTFLRQAKSAGHFSEMKDVEFAALQFAGLLQAFAFWPPIIRGEEPPTTRRRNKIARETVRMFLSRYGS